MIKYYLIHIIIFNTLIRQNSNKLSSSHNTYDDNNLSEPNGTT